MKKNVLKYVISFVLAGVLVYYAFKGVDWAAFWAGLQETRWGWVGMFIFFSILALVLREERWRAIIRPHDPQASRLDIWDATNVGNVVNVVLPGAGEFVRCGYVSRRGLSYDKAFGTIICERACDIVAIVLLFAIALVTGWGKFGGFFVEQIWQPMVGRMGFSLWLILAAAVLLVAGGLWAIFHWSGSNRFCGKIAQWLKGIVAGFASLGKMEHKGLFVLYTVGIWASYVAMSWTGLKAVPALSGLTFADALFISAVGNIASVIPVPGGIGAYHYLVALTLQSLYGATWDMGILYATLCHESHAILIILLGVISYVSYTLRHRRKSADQLYGAKDSERG
ncbi:MAG: flippase-like domain-containing protein [Bacteroidales bacterium]|nr:flippase-like domain-containing protein [Bacteroidales bacterium]